MNKHKQGDTWRVGTCQITYNPEFSPSLPYCLFVAGTAVLNFATLHAAIKRAPVEKSLWSIQ